jgi:hypothetical protein
MSAPLLWSGKAAVEKTRATDKILARKRKAADQPAVVKAGGVSKYHASTPRAKANIDLLEAKLADGCAVCGTHENVEMHHTEGEHTQKGGHSLRAKAKNLGAAEFAAELARCQPLCKKHHKEMKNK